MCYECSFLEHKKKQTYVASNRKVHYLANFTKYSQQENSFVSPRNAGVFRNKLSFTWELIPLISVLSMDIAVRKLEKDIVLHMSQIDFVELARVTGCHLVLLTALSLEERGVNWCQAS